MEKQSVWLTENKKCKQRKRIKQELTVAHEKQPNCVESVQTEGGNEKDHKTQKNINDSDKSDVRNGEATPGREAGCGNTVFHFSTQEEEADRALWASGLPSEVLAKGKKKKLR